MSTYFCVKHCAGYLTDYSPNDKGWLLVPLSKAKKFASRSEVRRFLKTIPSQYSEFCKVVEEDPGNESNQQEESNA